jgi:hypothetical protein
MEQAWGTTKPTPEQIRAARAETRSAEDVLLLEDLRRLSGMINTVRQRLKLFRKKPLPHRPCGELEYMWRLAALRGKVRSILRDLNYEDRGSWPVNPKHGKLIPLAEYDEIMKREQMPEGYDWRDAVLSSATRQSCVPAFGATPDERAWGGWVYVWKAIP